MFNKRHACNETWVHGGMGPLPRAVSAVMTRPTSDSRPGYDSGKSPVLGNCRFWGLERVMMLLVPEEGVHLRLACGRRRPRTSVRNSSNVTAMRRWAHPQRIAARVRHGSLDMVWMQRPNTWELEISPDIRNDRSKAPE
jgi:hypothetical protein